MLKLPLQGLFLSAHMSHRAMVLHRGCSHTLGRKRDHLGWGTCLSVYSIPNPIMHFISKRWYLIIKIWPKCSGRSFNVIFPPSQQYLEQTFKFLSHNHCFLHGSWWIFLSLEDSSSCGLKKNNKYSETNTKTPRPGSAASPLWAISIPSCSPLNHTVQGSFLLW